MTEKRRRKQKGSSLILAVCVMAFVTVMCLMILLTVYSLNRRMKLAEHREQCRMMAESVSLWLSDELTEKVYRERPKDPENSLFDYVGYGIMDPEESWPSYDPEDERGVEQSVRRFVLKTDDLWPEEGGEVRLALYWTREEPGLRLYMEITCSLKEVSSSARRVFSGRIVEEEQEEESGEEWATNSEANRKREEDGEDEEEESQWQGEWKWEILGREFEEQEKGRGNHR